MSLSIFLRELFQVLRLGGKFLLFFVDFCDFGLHLGPIWGHFGHILVSFW